MTKVGFITDIHLGYPDVGRDVILQALRNSVELFKGADIDHMVCLGDMIHESDDREQDFDNLTAVVDILDDKSYGSTFIAGNHDANAMSYREFTAFTGSHPTSIERQDCTLVFPRTAWDSPMENVGYINEDDIEFMENELSADTTNVLCSHYPMQYTSQYQNSTYFNKYPEGVFPINKYDAEKGMEKIDYHVAGHMHYPVIEPYFNIVRPIIDFDNGTAREKVYLTEY